MNNWIHDVFATPAWLWLMVPAAVLAGWDAQRRWQDSKPWLRLLASAVRLLVVAGLVTALADPRWRRYDDVSHVIVVVDRSASIPQETLADAMRRVDTLRDELDDDTAVGLVLFDGDAAVTVLPGQTWAVPDPLRGTPVDSTDIDSALRLAMGLIPANNGGQVVLVSDGRHTALTPRQGGALTQARQRGIAIHTIAVHPDRTDPAVTAVVLGQSTVRPGAEVEGTVELDGADSPQRGTLVVRLGDQQVAEHRVEIPAEDSLIVPWSHSLDVKTEPGTLGLSVEFIADKPDGDRSNNRAATTLVVGNAPQVRMFSGETHDATALARALAAERMDVDVIAIEDIEPKHEDFSDVDLVVLANAPAASIAGRKALQPRLLKNLTRFVDAGGGLVVLGGPQAYDMGGYGESQLARILPVKLEPVDPEIQTGATIVIILDVSGSMSALVGRRKTKMELADEGAAASIRLLRPFDRVGVISGTETAHWEVRVGPVRDTTALERKVMRIRSDGGGIYVYTNLEEAYRGIARSDTPLRHVILFSDAADSEEKIKGVPYGTGFGETNPSCEDLATRMSEIGITTSVIGIGNEDDVDTGFLRRLAEAGGGRFYLTNDATQLRSLFVEETERLVDTSLHEEQFHPQVRTDHPMIAGIDYRLGPQLSGYQTVESRPTAEVVLAGPNDAPLLTTWRYGLGHVVAWASDAGPRWSEKWLTWEGFSKQWTQAARFALKNRAGGETAVEVSFAGGQAQVRVARRDSKGMTIDEGALSARIRDGETTRPLPLRSTEPGLWESRVPTAAGNSYTIEVLGHRDEVLATHTFAPPPSAERRHRTADIAWLRELARNTAGQFDPRQLPTQATSTVTTDTRHLWPWFVLLSLLLWPADAFLRRTARVV